eukprot:scaffold94896_cov69-Phaeocystis_antarctica.AAC.5
MRYGHAAVPPPRPSTVSGRRGGGATAVRSRARRPLRRSASRPQPRRTHPPPAPSRWGRVRRRPPRSGASCQGSRKQAPRSRGAARVRRAPPRASSCTGCARAAAQALAAPRSRARNSMTAATHTSKGSLPVGTPHEAAIAVVCVGLVTARLVTTLVGVAVINPSGWGINIVDAPLSGAWHVLWGPTGTPCGRAEGRNMQFHTKTRRP